MNKKAVKYVLIVSGIVLLLGLGIWGYKYIKNRNDDKKTNENKNDLKELANLTSYMTSTVTDDNSNRYTLKYYYNGPIKMETCLIGRSNYGSCIKSNFYLTIYVEDSIKLKSSWMFYSFEASSNEYINSFKPTKPKNLFTKVLNSKFLVISLSNYTFCRPNYTGSGFDILCNDTGNDVEKTYYPYTKVFDATTGDMIFAVPTNSNETLTAPSGTYGTCTKFNNNMCTDTDNNALYYLKSVYENGSSKVEVRKVTFSDSYYTNDHPFKYLDEVAKPN